MVWDWMGGVPSRGKEELQTESSSESCWLKQERSWCRNRDERGRLFWVWKPEPVAGKSTCKGERWEEKYIEERADRVRSKRRR